MFCKRWLPCECIPRAELLATILMQKPEIVGVALTGSVARYEKAHDIDLLVVHNGGLEDQFCSDPQRKKGDYGNYGDELPVSVAIESGLISRSLTQARYGIPVNYIFVHEKIFWECSYLRDLSKKERFPEFFLRVVCDIPLFLLNPFKARGMLQKFLGEPAVVCLDKGKVWEGLSYPTIPLRHICAQLDFYLICRPVVSWKQCGREIKRRKGHWWHF